MEPSTNRQIQFRHPCNYCMSIFPRRRNNLILKHEILSEECDMFRSSLPRKIYANRLIQMIGILVGSGLIHYCYLKLNVFILISLAVGIIFVLQRTIEERLLFIKGLGVQYTRINGFYQEVCNFYPLESIDKFYIFEAVDGLKYRHFLTIRLRNQENIITFENMRPPLDFLRRVYKKYQEIEC